MTLQSLQKIISLENNLYAVEQAEQEKASSWLEEQQAEILRQHGEKLVALEEERKRARAEAAEEAQQKADAKVREAKDRAASLERMDDAVLKKHLERTFRFLAGQAL